MNLPITVDLSIHESQQQFDLTVAENAIVYTIEPTEQIVVQQYDAQPYEGSYSVVPKVEAQSVPCKNKRMISDLTVTAIPYFEASNQNGTTVYIADEI